nr:MAG TPA_asm: hypothetical protein [Bacteriophage sp.]DAL35266.1 MAG TPA_asm: hypothetical protein [Caudoviricetes sp.]
MYEAHPGIVTCFDLTAGFHFAWRMHGKLQSTS